MNWLSRSSCCATRSQCSARQIVRPALEPADRALLAGLSRLLSRVRRGCFFVQPETLLRWHRDLDLNPSSGSTT